MRMLKIHLPSVGNMWMTWHLQKILHLYLENSLKWNKQADNILKKANNRLFILRTLIHPIKEEYFSLFLGSHMSTMLMLWVVANFTLLFERRENHHCRKFVERFLSNERTKSLLPAPRFECHGRTIRNSTNISQIPVRTKRFENSRIPYLDFKQVCFFFSFFFSVHFPLLIQLVLYLFSVCNFIGFLNTF